MILPLYTCHRDDSATIYCMRAPVTELEDEEPVINWSLELTERLGSRLYALWNRTAGDCLLDSVLQASWGVMDRDNTLRRCLADSLCEGTCM